MSKVYTIAEIGINHNGDINLAKELIDMAKQSGCDAVKFQKRDIDSVYSKEELDTLRESPFGTTTREQKEGIEFSIEECKELESYTKANNLDFIVSCWDMASLELVEEHLDVKYHKVASAMATDKGFLEALNNSGRPVILSVGMCTQEEVDAAVNILNNIEYILACTSTYPTKEDEINLNYITTLKNKYPNLKVGFSNHYNGLTALIGATALNSECLEFHITKDRTMYGSDQVASIESVTELMVSVRKLETMLGDGEKVVYDSEVPIAKKIKKSKRYMSRLISIIPARGGSKGVPGKNIKNINGMPLLAYPIISAQKTKYITEVYVSTDDESIKEVALSYGAKVIDRPSEFAQDDSLDIDVMRHAVEYLDDYGDIVHLRATTPMIESNVLDDAIDYFLQNDDCTGMRSAHEAPETAYKSFKKSGDYWGGLFDHQLEGDYYNLPRQSLPKTYNPNGYVDIIRPKHFMNDDNLHGDKMLAYITPFTHDVDTLDDFKLLEVIYG